MLDMTKYATSEQFIAQLVEYVFSKKQFSSSTLKLASYCLMDSIACAIASLNERDCVRQLGPLVAGTVVPNGVPVFGTGDHLDPVKAAFDISAMIRWMDFSDTTFAGGHPSDSIGAILASADYRSRNNLSSGQGPLLMEDIFIAITQAYEIQGMVSVANKFDHPDIGIDHVIGVKIASTLLAVKLLGGTAEIAKAALSNMFMDGGTLNAYRHVPNAGPRKSWAGADAASRGVWLAMAAIKGEPGYFSSLGEPVWGFEKVFLGGHPIKMPEALDSFVLDNVIFKFYPCQRNVTTALECAIQLHPWFLDRINTVRKINIFSQDEAIRRTDKRGPLLTRAARDHCMQYIVSIGLLHGRLTQDDYLDEIANDPRIDFLRNRMTVIESPSYTESHHDLSIRSCANAIQIELLDGTLSDLVEVQFPSGDPSKRDKVEAALLEKFHISTEAQWDRTFRESTSKMLLDLKVLEKTSVPDFMDSLQTH
jgi:2-methylcitrate dehydratase